MHDEDDGHGLYISSAEMWERIARRLLSGERLDELCCDWLFDEWGINVFRENGWKS